MTPAEILDVVNKSPALFNARYYKDAETIAAFINVGRPKVTVDEVRDAIAEQKIHPGTGEPLE